MTVIGQVVYCHSLLAVAVACKAPPSSLFCARAPARRARRCRYLPRSCAPAADTRCVLEAGHVRQGSSCTDNLTECVAAFPPSRAACCCLCWPHAFAAAGPPASMANRRCIMGISFGCFTLKPASTCTHFLVYIRTFQHLTSKPLLRFRSRTATRTGLLCLPPASRWKLHTSKRFKMARLGWSIITRAAYCTRTLAIPAPFPKPKR